MTIEEATKVVIDSECEAAVNITGENVRREGAGGLVFFTSVEQGVFSFTP